MKFTKMTIGLVMTRFLAGPALVLAGGPAEQTELLNVSHQARKFYIQGSNAFRNESLEKKLFKKPEFKNGTLMLVSLPKLADVMILLERKPFTYEMIHCPAGFRRDPSLLFPRSSRFNKGVTDATGNKERESDYLPFGKEKVVGTATGDNPHKFAGMYMDSDSDRSYTKFRMYSFKQGRWLSPDPLHGSVGNPQSINRYAYVLHNPVNLFDPLGFDACISFEDTPWWVEGDSDWYCREGRSDCVVTDSCDHPNDNSGFPRRPPYERNQGGNPSRESDTPEPPDDVCAEKIINALNKKFGGGFNNDQIVERTPPRNANGTYYVAIKAENLPRRAFKRIRPGRFTVGNNFFTRAIFPVGPTLHINGNKKGKFSKINMGETTTVNFLVHLDQGNPLPGGFPNPVGATVHGLLNMALPPFGVKENPCP